VLARCLLSGGAGKEVAIFYSYSREDADVRSHVDEILGRFKWDVAVRTWYDGMIPGGTEWENFRNIDAADLIILFITRKFVRSEYCMLTELPRALARHERGEAVVVPVIVESTQPDWRDLGLGKLQVLPGNGRAIEEWDDRDSALRSVVQGIVDIIVGRELDPKSRCRWQLHLRGNVGQFDDAQQLDVVNAMRTVSEDPTLRPLAIGEGSIVLHVDSTRAGLEGFRSWHRSNSAQKLAGLEILRLIELFGAGVQASLRHVLAADVGPSTEDVGEDWLLYPSPPWEPTQIRGIHYSEEDPLHTLSCIIDSGDDKPAGARQVAESNRLVGYFTTALCVPEDDQWVNLSPDDKNRMLGKGLAGTAMGRDLLDMDVKLKRLAASLLHPDCDTGDRFWREVRRQRAGSGARDGVALGTFQRVWVSPEKATVYERDMEVSPGVMHRGAFVVESVLKVQCEDDYLGLYGGPDGAAAVDANAVCTPLFKGIILPVIEDEVRHGKTFARERQVVQGAILASWVKGHCSNHPIWKRFIDSGDPQSLVSGGIIDLESVADLTRMLGLDGDGPPEVRRGESTSGGPTAGTADVPRTEQAPDARLAEAVAPRESGSVGESIVLLRRLVEERTSGSGGFLQPAQSAISQLGRSLRAAGQLDEATACHRRVLEIRRFVLGDDHPHTLNSMVILADTLEAAGRIDAACELRAEAREREARTGDAFSIEENREFHELYMRVFRQGVFRLTRNEYESDVGECVARTYFSGAIDLRTIPLRVIRG
jgi:hypothetical protein